MPYIAQERRKQLKEHNITDPTPGDINYAITEMIRDYWYQSAQNYQAINDVLGALEGAKHEFYRRVAVPYEDKKKKENGDVY